MLEFGIVTVAFVASMGSVVLSHLGDMVNQENNCD